MGIFDRNDDNSSSRNEVVVDVSENEKNGKGEKRLKNEVSSKLSNERETDKSEINLKDLHEQNKRIIELLEQLTDDKNDSKINNTMEKDNNEEQGLEGGMNELL